MSKPNFLLRQSYETPTPYAPVFAHHTVHTVGPRDCCMGHDKSLLQSKKLIIIISLKLYIVCESQLLSSQEERCFYISARKKA